MYGLGGRAASSGYACANASVHLISTPNISHDCLLTWQTGTMGDKSLKKSKKSKKSKRKAEEVSAAKPAATLEKRQKIEQSIAAMKEVSPRSRLVVGVGWRVDGSTSNCPLLLHSI